MLLFNPASLLFMSTLSLGAFIAISSPTWFTSWLGLELNVLSFIPLILFKPNNLSSDAAIKYFLIQAAGSATLMAGAMIILILPMIPKALMMLSLLLKMGAAPLHFWLPTIMQNMNWIQCAILMTLQKIAPMALLSYTIYPTTASILMISSIFSALVGGIGGLNQTLMRKILAYSSINHMAWMLAGIYLKSTLWMNYLLIYSLVSITMIFLLNSNQIFHIKQLISISSSKVNKISMFLSLFSLGGLPPFLGFIPKLMMAVSMAGQNLMSWLFILTMSALITLFYYTRMSITALTLGTPFKKPDIIYSPTQQSSTSLFINLFPIFLPMILFVQF